MIIEKQPSRGVLMKRCSENVQQIYRRTPMPKCDFNKVAKQFYLNRTSTAIKSIILTLSNKICCQMHAKVAVSWKFLDFSLKNLF